MLKDKLIYQSESSVSLDVSSQWQSPFFWSFEILPEDTEKSPFFGPQKICQKTCSYVRGFPTNPEMLSMHDDNHYTMAKNDAYLHIGSNKL